MNHIILSLICLFISIILIDVEISISNKYKLDLISPKIIIFALIILSIIYLIYSSAMTFK